MCRLALLAALLLAALSSQGCGGSSGGSTQPTTPPAQQDRDFAGIWSGELVSDYDGTSYLTTLAISGDDIFIKHFRGSSGHGRLELLRNETRATIFTAKPAPEGEFSALNAPIYIASEGIGRLQFSLTKKDGHIVGSYRLFDNFAQPLDEGSLQLSSLPVEPIAASDMRSVTRYRFLCGKDAGIYEMYCYASFSASQDGKKITGRYEEWSPYGPSEPSLYRGVPKAFDLSGVIEEVNVGSHIYRVTVSLPDAIDFVGIGWQPVGGQFGFISKPGDDRIGPPFIGF